MGMSWRSKRERCGEAGMLELHPILALYNRIESQGGGYCRKLKKCSGCRKDMRFIIWRLKIKIN